MKILIISRTPWNTDNSFGNTFSNIFSGLKEIEIYHICCQEGITKGSLAKKTLQISEKQILKNRKNFGKIVENKIEINVDKTLNINNKLKQLKILHICRDLIWKIGKVEKSKQLLNFINESNPDIIYLPLYNSWYMCDIQQYICNICKVPVIGHISDDIYSYSKGYFASPIEIFYKFILRTKLKKLIKRCNYLEVFANNMKDEYSKIFKKECFLIGKGIDTNTIKLNNSWKEKYLDPVEFIYTGNLGSERWKVLYELGMSLDRLSIYKKSVLKIYSGTIISSNIKKKFDKCRSIKFMGSVSSEEVKKIQQIANILVHVESFSNRAINETRMSFSTKIIDYLCTGKLILAIGPQEVNSIQVLEKNNLGLVVNKIENLDKETLKIILNKIDKKSISNNVQKYLMLERDIKKIQKEIYKRMLNLNKNFGDNSENSNNKCSI